MNSLAKTWKKSAPTTGSRWRLSMVLILDSSAIITAERKGETVAQLLKRALAVMGDQPTALSAIALVEMVHGIYRATTPAIRSRREAFVRELLADVSVHPFTQEVAFLAGKIDGEQQSRGVKIPFQDLLIGATALHLNSALLTGNARHFQMIPDLVVKQL